MIQLGARVEHPGWGTTVQDMGRQGVLRFGLTTGGATDPYALRWANHLLQNPPEAAALEILPGGFTLRLLADCQLALTGADLQATCNERPLQTWSSGWFRAGSVLQWGTARSGLRAYLAVTGGWQTPLCFGSRSTVVREGLGGIDGRHLKRGDELSMCVHEPQHSRTVAPRWQPNYAQPLTLRYVAGYQFEGFSKAALHAFHHAHFHVSPQSNRMGVRLLGPRLALPELASRSEPMALGTIQISGAGQPIVLLQERQTMGGYLKLGSVCYADCAALAQRAPGSLVSFKPMPRAELLAERVRWDQFFSSGASS